MTDHLSDRFRWSIQMQNQHALDIYRSHWDVDRIIEVDKEGDDGNGAMQALDFSGLDKIVITADGRQIHIAQRFRQPYHDIEAGWTQPDFSLRVESYHDDHVEYDKLMDSHNSVASVPGVYGFGRTPHGRQVALQNGFDEFYLIDVERFLDAHQGGDIPILEKAPNGDGSMGAYFDLDELDRHECFIECFRFSEPDDKQSITEWAEVGL